MISVITDITPEHLKRWDIKGLLLDVDNTLSTHGGMSPVPGLHNWLELMKQSGISLLIISNAKSRRVKPFAERLSLGFISMAMKPLPFKYISAKHKLNIPKKNILMIGDQLFTDILGAKLSGIKSALVAPVGTSDMKLTSWRRGYEKKLCEKYKQKGGFTFEI